MQIIIQKPYNKIIHKNRSRKECTHWLQAHVRNITHSFLSRNHTNRLFAASECYNLHFNDITAEQINSPEVFNYMYNYFLKYYTIESTTSKKQIDASLTITKFDIKEYNY